MRYVQLRAFHHVALHGGFSNAARALNLTQPAISDQVRKLEGQYDVLLFNRLKKQVTLTEAGDRLLEITHRMFENEHQAMELLNESRALSTGTLRIIADAAHHMHEILGRFQKKFPNIHITLHTGNTDDVIKALHAYQADIGVLGDVPKLAEFDILHLGNSPIIAFASKDFARNLPTRQTLQDLASQPLIFREIGSKTRQKLEESAKHKNITLTPMIEAEGREAVHELVANGVGIGFVSAAEFRRDDRIKQINITDLTITMDEALINLRERRGGKLIRAFVDLAATDR
ncbi:MAG: LysR family transcriptional regulator [Rhodobacteraceae bacterium]|nr:LysR family transcriptional regulator [Paracoccaceae bacterium]